MPLRLRRPGRRDRARRDVLHRARDAQRRSRAPSSARRRARRCAGPPASSRRARPPATSSSGCSTPTPTRIDVAYHGVDQGTFHVADARPRRPGCRRGSVWPGSPTSPSSACSSRARTCPGLIRGWVAGLRRAASDRRRWCWPAAPAGTTRSTRTIAEVPSHLRVLRPGYLRFNDLPGYLGGAVLVAYPSHGEGFGLPVLEAMACGAPVLTTQRLSLPEVGGDAVAYTEPDPDVDRRRARARCSTTPTAARSSARPGHERSLEFTWAASAEAHLAAFRARARAVSGRRRARERDARPRRRRHLLARASALGDFLSSLREPRRTRPYDVVLADNGSDRRRARGRGRRRACRLLPTGGNLGYGRGRQPRRRPAPTATWLVVANPDVVWSPGSLDELLDAGRALAAGRLPRPGDPHAGRPALPVGAGVPVARPRHRPRAARLVVAGEPVDRGPTAREVGTPVEGTDRLAVRLVHAAAARGVRAGRRLRPVVLHVLRGHGPVPPARPRPAGDNVYVPSSVVTHLGGHATSRAAGPMQREHHRALLPLPVAAVRRAGVRPGAAAARRRAAAALPARRPRPRRRRGRRAHPLRRRPGGTSAGGRS